MDFQHAPMLVLDVTLRNGGLGLVMTTMKSLGDDCSSVCAVPNVLRRRTFRSFLGYRLGTSCSKHARPTCVLMDLVWCTPCQVERDKRENRGEALPLEEERKIRDPILEKFEHESSSYYSSARLWDDGIIDPADTRRVLGLSLRVATRHAPDETTFGVFRM